MMFVVCCRTILRESGYPRYLHSSVLLGGTLLIFGGNTHNDTSLSNGAKCFSADFLAYDIGLWCYFTACLTYTTIKMSVIFIKWFCKTFLMLTKAAFIWSIYSKNNIVKYYKKIYIYFYIYLNMQFIPVMEKLHFQQPWLQSSVISSIINVDFFFVRIPLINRMFKGTAFFLLHFCNNVKIYFDQFNASLLKKTYWPHTLEMVMCSCQHSLKENLKKFQKKTQKLIFC